MSARRFSMLLYRLIIAQGLVPALLYMEIVIDCSVALSDRYILLKQDQAEPKTPPDSESFSEVKMEKWVGLQSEGEQGKVLIRLGVKKEEGERGRGSI